MSRLRLPALALPLVLVCLAAPVMAQETPAAPPPAVAEPQPMALDDLASVAAGESTKIDVLSTQDLSATNSGNSVTADTVTNGDISFSPGALTGFSGVGNFVSNTGNNNNLQGSISITIVTTPGLN